MKACEVLGNYKHALVKILNKSCIYPYLRTLLACDCKFKCNYVNKVIVWPQSSAGLIVVLG